jgi:histidinol-phosphate phosphatase family protein
MPAVNRLRPAIFFSARGALLPSDDVGCTGDLMPGAEAGLPLLWAAGYRLVVVAHQPEVARGQLDDRGLASMEARVRDVVSAAGAPVAGVYVCPHDQAGSVRKYAIACFCRRPRSGLLRQAAGDLKLDLGASWLIGDLLDDMETAHNGGCRGMLIDDGAELEWRTDRDRRPDGIADDLAEAAVLIAARGGIHA